MGLPEVGVKLVADNERGFLGSLRNATGAVDSFESNADRASTGVAGLGRSMTSLATGALKAVTAAATAAGVAIGGFVAGSVNMAAELEAQMSGVAAVLGVGNEELELLNDLVIDLGIDPNLKVSSVEAAEAIEVLAKNGVSLDEILDGVARQTVFLANATGAQLGPAADTMTDVMNIFGFSVDEAGEAVNGIAAVVQSSKFGFDDFSLALANGGAAAAAVGVSFEDFNTAIAAISPSFSSGMTAGTGLKNVLLRLVPSTEKAEDEMKALGIITEDGANRFFDAEGNMRGMAEVAGVLQDALAGLSDSQRSSALRTIFGNDAMGAAIALAQVGEEEFNNLSFSMNQVDAGQAASTRVDNFAGAMDILSGTVEAVRLQIGAAFLPILTSMAKKISSFVDEHGPKFTAFFEKAASFIGDFAARLMKGEGFIGSFLGALEGIGVGAEALNPIRETLQKIQEFFQKAFAFILEHKDRIIAALTGIGIAFGALLVIGTITSLIAALTNPITLVIAAISLLSVAWSENWGGIQEKTTAVINFIRPLVENAITSIKTFWAENGDEILAKASATWEAVKTAVQKAVLFIRDQVIVPVLTALAKFWIENGEEITAKTKETWEGIKEFIGKLINNIKLIIEAAIAAIQGDWTTFGEKLGEAWGNAWENIKALGIKARDALVQMMLGIIEKVLAIEWGSLGTDIIKGIAGGISAAAGILIDAARGAAQAAFDAAAGFLRADSPSKLFEELGMDTGEGLAIGIANTSGMVATSAASLGATAAGAVISPPASAAQITNQRIVNNTSNLSVNLNNSFASQPTITDGDVLLETLAAFG